jgi:DNA (cytosine-5)-methyltransferase 1
MTHFEEWDINETEFDLLAGGTPCQSFSIAGLRGGLADDRGNLALTYCRILQKFRPKWFLWENVPGVLSSSGGRDFGSILGAMEELGYGVAYRVLDAQYFGVPQRRRRVFVVGCLGNWRRAAQVLFEPGCVSGDSSKGRKKRTAVAALTATGVGTCGADDNQGQA